MIKSFKCKETEKIWNEEFSKKLHHDIQKRALQKLRMLNASSVLEDLKIPPGNKFEHLSGNLKDYCSIGINDQWRIQFKFQNNEAYEVQIVDYH